jgi:NAD(P) transhydrogenase subunit alpha
MTHAFVPKETAASETRVAVSPETVKRLVQCKLALTVESGAGRAAGFEDAVLAAAGATIGDATAWGTADLVLKVAPPSPSEVARLKPGAVLVSMVLPAANLPAVEALRERRVSSLALDLVPRISRAQSMDVLSSQATVAGYKAVLLGASHLNKMCPLLMTAAGTVPPARAVIFGVGVAGLQAIATARRLGCVVEATDIRRATKEQVESLGARFIDVPGAADMETAGGYAKEVTPEFLEQQRAEVAKRVAEADLVITTAQVPGRKAPRLVSRAMVESMRPGSVIVDLAVDSGGNCELSVLGEVVEHKGVKIVGVPNLPATVPQHASELFAKNVLNLVKLFVSKEGAMSTEFTDEVLAGCLLTHAGEVRHAPTAEALAAGSAK